MARRSLVWFKTTWCLGFGWWFVVSSSTRRTTSSLCMPHWLITHIEFDISSQQFISPPNSGLANRLTFWCIYYALCLVLMCMVISPVLGRCYVLAINAAIPCFPFCVMILTSWLRYNISCSPSSFTFHKYFCMKLLTLYVRNSLPVSLSNTHIYPLYSLSLCLSYGKQV